MAIPNDPHIGRSSLDNQTMGYDPLEIKLKKLFDINNEERRQRVAQILDITEVLHVHAWRRSISPFPLNFFAMNIFGKLIQKNIVSHKIQRGKKREYKTHEPTTLKLAKQRKIHAPVTLVSSCNHY